MVVTLLSRAGNILEDELSYDILYTMFDKINIDLHNEIKDEKDELYKLFKESENAGLSPEDAVLKHSSRISTYTNTALFKARKQTVENQDLI